MKGLIVEDCKIMAQIITQLVLTVSFEKNGQKDELTHADNILFALNLLEKNNFDYIFLDLNLRDDIKSQNRNDGLIVLKHIRERNDTTPVFITTGDSNINTVKTVLQHKPTDYLVKPVTKKTVKRCFNKINQ